MKLFLKVFATFFAIALAVDATLWHGFYRTEIGHRLHSFTTGLSSGRWETHY